MTVNSKKPLVWGATAILLLAVVAGIFYKNSSQQHSAEQTKFALKSGIDLFNQQKHAEAIDVLAGVPDGSDQEWRARYYQGSALIMLLVPR